MSLSNLSIKRDQQIIWGLISILWLLAILSLLKAELMRAHLGLLPDWFQMSPYFFIPAALWSLSLPFLQKITHRYKIDTIGGLKIHLLVSLIFSPVLNFVSFFLDFSLKKGLGSMHVSFFNFMEDSRIIFFERIINYIIVYWLLILAFNLIYYKSLVTSGKNKIDKIPLKVKEGLEFVSADDILYIQAFGNYLKIYTTDNVICKRGTIKSFYSQLDHKEFYRVHRSYIANIKWIKAIGKGRLGNHQIELINGKRVPTGLKYRESITKVLIELTS